MFRFQLTSQPSGPVAARTGLVETARGTIHTPAFMPVGTLATVKALEPAEVRAAGAEIVLANAYHLFLRPGHELIRRLGGVHAFMGWNGPVLSDSGGFQVFSLARLQKVRDEGVTFRSHVDGSEHFYSPETAMEVQSALGVDIAMPLDHVVAPDASVDVARDAAERTIRWYDRCAAVDGAPPIFAIVQGGIDPGLRRWHTRELASREAPGYSIGGLSVGESKADMWAMTELVTAELPVDRPRYLMGVGSPEDLVEAVSRGVDMFDCVLPTRLGRNGSLFTSTGRVNIRNARFAESLDPVEPGCDCHACTHYSAAYLNHLFKNDEMLGHRLGSIHNIRFLVRLTERMRDAIQAGTFPAFAEAFLAGYRPVDEAVRAEQRDKWLVQSGFEQKPG